MGSTAQSVSVNQDTWDSIGIGVGTLTTPYGGAFLASYSAANMAKRNAVDNPEKAAVAAADKQAVDTGNLLAQKSETERINNLGLKRDREMAASMAAAKSARNANNPNTFTSPLGVPGGQLRTGKTLLGQ